MDGWMDGKIGLYGRVGLFKDVGVTLKVTYCDDLELLSVIVHTLHILTDIYVD